MNLYLGIILFNWSPSKTVGAVLVGFINFY